MTVKEQITISAPATVANVACGFDVLGFAVDAPTDEVTVRLADKKGVSISKIEGDGGKLPLDPDKNTATVAILKFMQHIQSDQGLEIELKKGVPFAGGMGSSSASSVAGVFAVNELLGKPLKTEELLPFAMEGERIACGIAHADNVGPALLGGFVIIRSYKPLDVVKISCPANLHCTLIHPDVEVRTEDARKILKQKIELKDAISQWGNVAGLIAGLMNSDYNLIGRSLKDELIEPIRSLLIPGFDEVKNAALQAGALGCSISGSGPSVFALNSSKEKAEKIGTAMQDAFSELGIKSGLYVSKINEQGPKIIS
ncbi:homoserine kinase [Bacteroidales bacterium AH-315-I05]|nr:homoserine kinase [Bacteroidales bacterium AH-315-I05]